MKRRSAVDLIVKQNVKLIGSRSIMSGRSGTVLASISDLIRVFGSPIKQSYFDDKVTMAWYFQTPRGPVEVRDYWWNVKGVEWSIATENRKAVKWLKRFLQLNLRAFVPNDDLARTSDLIRELFTVDEIHAGEHVWKSLQ